MLDKIFSHPKRDIAQKAVDKHHLGCDKEKEELTNFETVLSEKNKKLNEKIKSYDALKAQVSNLLPYIDTGTFTEFCETNDYGCIINDIISKLDKMEEERNENN